MLDWGPREVPKDSVMAVTQGGACGKEESHLCGCDAASLLWPGQQDTAWSRGRLRGKRALNTSIIRRRRKENKVHFAAHDLKEASCWTVEVNNQVMLPSLP